MRHDLLPNVNFGAMEIMAVEAAAGTDSDFVGGREGVPFFFFEPPFGRGCEFFWTGELLFFMLIVVLLSAPGEQIGDFSRQIVR
jgi:hypothetical protein